MMNGDKSFRVAVSFPGELDYIPLVRKLISDMLQALGFSGKFTFRSELIIDELCNNAVSYGASIDRSAVDLMTEIFSDRVEFTVTDRGGTGENIQRLKQAIETEPVWKGDEGELSRGLDLVRMLAEKVSCSVDEQNLTQIHVVRNREEIG